MNPLQRIFTKLRVATTDKIRFKHDSPGGTTPAREGITMVFSTRRAIFFARNDQQGRDDEEGGEPTEEGIQQGAP